jgi:hypothetical protein
MDSLISATNEFPELVSSILSLHYHPKHAHKAALLIVLLSRHWQAFSESSPVIDIAIAKLTWHVAYKGNHAFEVSDTVLRPL